MLAVPVQHMSWGEMFPVPPCTSSELAALLVLQEAAWLQAVVELQA